MRYLLLSDTHGLVQEACMLIEHWSERIDGVWHLGDLARDLDFLQKQYGSLQPPLAFSGVCGNCDASGTAPDFRFFTLCDRKILMCHGHRYYVNDSLWYLRSRARELGADVVLFGHTHIPFCEEQDGILFVNPGSLTSPRGGNQASFGLLEIEKGQAAASIMQLSPFLS